MKTFRAISWACFWQMLCLVPFGAVSAQDLCEPVGWATENGGVTGGGNATPVVVSSFSELESAVTDENVKVVHVSGTITMDERITIQDQSDKSIIGLPGARLVSTDQSSGSSGIFYVKRCENFIMRNLVFEGPGAYDVDGYDNLCIDDSRNFWVDHCDFEDGVDGNFDIKNKADFISVTWCTFTYKKPPRSGGSGGSDDHRYSNLIGSSDGATGDAGKLNVTFYYCRWGEGVRERMPRMRYGKLHMVNNLFDSDVSNHCIRAGYKADILLEGNFFDDQDEPVDEFKGDYTGIRAVANAGLADMEKRSAFSPPYSIPIASAQDIVDPIKNCAGATLTSVNGCSSCGGEVNQSPEVEITAPVDNALFDAPANISIQASAGDVDGSVSKVEFFNGSTRLGEDNSASYSFTWSNVEPGSYTITAKATDDQGATAVSSPITVVVNDPNLPSLVSTSNLTQVVDTGAAISPIVFTWGGAATDVSYTTLPDGLTASKNSVEKTLTVSGIASTAGTFSVSTIGADQTITLEASVATRIPASILADWYAFQEEPISLDFVTFTDASVDTDYYDQSKPSNGVAYTAGALRLNKGTGSITLALQSLDVLKIRWYATGQRSMKVVYGPGGTENSWHSPDMYSSGAHELDLTDMIPELVSATPIIVTIINDRTNGGSLNIQDLYVEGSKNHPTNIKSFAAATSANTGLRFVCTGRTLEIVADKNNATQSAQPAMIMDMLGKTVIHHDFSRKIDISRLHNGIYIVKVGSTTAKFLKK
ncbi:MAG: Ig-like domain-containing protein [Chitinivibrionales bacterium]